MKFLITNPRLMAAFFIFLPLGAMGQKLPPLEEAEQWFAKKSESIVYAQKAVDMYTQLANEEENPLARGYLLIKKATALHSVGDHKNYHKGTYKKAVEITDSVVQIFKYPQNLEEEELLSIALYRYGISLARTIGGINIGKIKKKAFKVLATMEHLIHQGWKHLDFYGPHRAIGAMRFQIPSWVSLPLPIRKKPSNTFVRPIRALLMKRSIFLFTGSTISSI